MKRWAIVGLVVVLGALGFAGYRWWNSDGHQTAQFLSEVRDKPGVVSATHSDETGRDVVAMSPTASPDEVDGVIRTLRDRALGKDRQRGLVQVGQASMRIDQYIDGSRLAPLLLAMGNAKLPAPVAVSDASGAQVRADLTDQGPSAIDMARVVLQAFVARPDALNTDTEVWVNERQSDIGGFGEVSLNVDRVNLSSRIAELDRARPLATWHPSLRLYPKEVDASLLIPNGADATKAVAQARSVLGPHVRLSYLLGDSRTHVVADANPARALALVGDLAVNDETEVLSIGPNLSTVEVRTTYDALPAALATVAKAKAGSVHFLWEGSDLETSTAAAQKALPGITQLHDLGYTLVWAPPVSSGDAVRIGVAPSGTSEEDRVAASSKLEGKTDGLDQLSRAVRALGWPGKVEVHIPVVTDDKLKDQVFVSTATGRATRAPGQDVPATGVTEAWDKTATQR